MRTPCRRSRLSVGVDTVLGFGATPTSAEHVVARDRVDTEKTARQQQLLHRTKPVPIPAAARERGRWAASQPLLQHHAQKPQILDVRGMLQRWCGDCDMYNEGMARTLSCYSESIAYGTTLCPRSFVPEDFRVPQRIEQANYVLRPLTTADVEKDYEAVMSSKQSLRQIFGEHDEWPAEHMTVQENERDLERHQTDFEQRQGFTYTVETPDGDACLGCVYIYPCQRGDYDARVHYWVRDSVKAQGVEAELGAFLRQWLREAWPFRQPVFPGRDVSWQEWEALKNTAV